jgi:hypothetical protein
MSKAGRTATRPGIDGYLVVAVYAMDDIPVLFAATVAQAREEARRVWKIKNVDKNVRDIMGSDASMFFGVAIVTFKAGKPISKKIAHWSE